MVSAVDANGHLPAPSSSHGEEDFVSLDVDDANNNISANAYGYTDAQPPSMGMAPTGPRAMSSRESIRYKSEQNQNQHHHQQGYLRSVWFQRRHAEDRPQSKHDLPGHAPWVLVKTKYGRRFVHNTITKESLWRVPHSVLPGVLEFEKTELVDKEKEENAQWAEQQLAEMRAKSRTEEINSKANEEGRARRRRSESLQREDEEAMMAELAAQAERQEENDVKEVVKKLDGVEPQELQQNVGGYESDSSYEEVEVTDSEFEDEGDETLPVENKSALEEQGDEAVEFGEDDIAYQLAAMGEEYGLDAGEYGEDENGEWEEGAEGLPLSDEEAANLFRDMLDDHHISPYTPWDKLITDESDSSILLDDRYTVLTSTRARHDVWESWVKERATQLQHERATTEKPDPRVPYLALLAAHATPKLYWPEFKRKFKRESSMTDRHLSDKDREKLYREHIARLKLPDRTRIADLHTLLDTLPRSALRASSEATLPNALTSHIHYISLPSAQRDSIIMQYIARIPSNPAGIDQDGNAESDINSTAGATAQQRERAAAAALEARRREVNEQKRQAEKEERWARRDLHEGEREVQRAMMVGKRGLQGQLDEESRT